MMKYLLLALCMFTMSSMASAQETKKFTAEKHNEYGLTYSLPKTHLDIEVVATKTTYKAGPYCKYAQRYLGVQGAIMQNTESWELTSIQASPYGVPDSQQQYLIQFKAGGEGYIVLNEDGLLLSINTEPVIEQPVTTEPIAKEESILDNNEYAKAFSEEMLMSASTVKMAEMAAKQLYRIRESRMNLVTGEVDELPADGESFRLVMEQLDKQEAALTAMFMGTTQTETAVAHFDYVPDTTENNVVICRISDHYGIVDADNLSGDPIYLNVEITEKGKLPVDVKGHEKKMPKDAVAYTIPGEAMVTLTDGKQELFRKPMPIAQFGIVFGLDPTMFSHKKHPSCATFYPQTGAIRQIGK